MDKSIFNQIGSALEAYASEDGDEADVRLAPSEPSASLVERFQRLLERSGQIRVVGDLANPDTIARCAINETAIQTFLMDGLPRGHQRLIGTLIREGNEETDLGSDVNVARREWLAREVVLDDGSIMHALVSMDRFGADEFFSKSVVKGQSAASPNWQWCAVREPARKAVTQNPLTIGAECHETTQRVFEDQIRQ